MACGRSLRGASGTVALVTLLLAALPAAAAVTPADKLDEVRTLARQAEKDGDWAKACAYYSYLLSKDRSLADVAQRFQTCLRHFHRARRHNDASYRRQVLSQDITTALKVYGEVLEQLRAEFWQESRADLTRLFRQGVEELRLALRDDAFRRQYLPEATPEAVDEFAARLRGTWAKKEVRFILDAQAQVLQLALAAKQSLGLNATVTVLEFACGACNALDEHTYYLTPRQFGDDAAALRGDAVGVGIEVTVEQQRLVVAQVFLNSPAFKAGVLLGDRILRIGAFPAEQLSAEGAAEKLKGKNGTSVELEVASLNDKPRTLTLTRQPIQVSVTDYRLLDGDTGVGYVQVATFHENTLQELDAALNVLDMQGLKSLVLDLRGNPGGSFEAAVKVAERFLGEGAFIVSTQARAREVRRTSHNMNPLPVPVVVLVDGGTASAAEIVAGALKDNGRATLIGQVTFGKTTVQHLLELKTVQAGGIRLTWAKFFTPLGRDDGGGISPHLLVERTSRGFDDQLQAAKTFLAGMGP